MRLQELLFVRGAHFERDTMLLNISTFAFDSHAQLLSEVDNYINRYQSSYQSLSNNEPGVSRQTDPRIIVAAPRCLAFGMDRILS